MEKISKLNKIIVMCIDVFLVAICIYLSFLLRFDFKFAHYYNGIFLKMLIFCLFLKLCVFYLFDLYRGMWRYTSLNDVKKIVLANITSSSIIFLSVLTIFKGEGFPRSVVMIDCLLTILAITGIRTLIRLFLNSGKNLIKKRVILMGAGKASEMVLREIQANKNLGIFVAGLLDDKRGIQDKSIHGIKIIGFFDDLLLHVDKFDEILIAVPSADSQKMRRFVSLCEQTGKPYRTLPHFSELINGQASIRKFRNVMIEDLVGRQEVELDIKEISKYLQGRRVLVTGAGGSIGSELVRQILKFQPGSLGLLDISEHNLFQIEEECRTLLTPHSISLIPFLSDIRDKMKLNRVIEKLKPEIIFHAAAYKHVPMQESFPWEAVSNNIGGTLNLVQAAKLNNVKKFILVSTDKAVRPTNVMGATKRIAEMLVESCNGSSQTEFLAVRFGNVLESSGSVIPSFKKQIDRGGPLTVTHPEVTRYFMTIPEAAQLILQAGALGKGREIFVLDMGRPIKILDMAKQLIRLSGLEPEVDIPIKYIGLRPGEKLYEELLTSEEGIKKTVHKKIMVLQGDCFQYDDIVEQIESIRAIAQTFDPLAIKAKLKEIVPEYTLSNSLEKHDNIDSLKSAPQDHITADLAELAEVGV